MKMDRHLYDKLAAALRDAPKAETERQRWDALFEHAGHIVGECYRAGLNDAHIDTALRRIFR